MPCRICHTYRIIGGVYKRFVRQYKYICPHTDKPLFACTKLNCGFLSVNIDAVRLCVDYPAVFEHISGYSVRKLRIRKRLTGPQRGIRGKVQPFKLLPVSERSSVRTVYSAEHLGAFRNALDFRHFRRHFSYPFILVFTLLICLAFQYRQNSSYSVS